VARASPVVVGLVIAAAGGLAMQLLVIGQNTRGRAVGLSAIALSPSGDFLAAVHLSPLGSRARRDAQGDYEVMVVPASRRAGEGWRRQCASPSAVWLDHPVRLVYGVRDNDGIALAVADPVTGDVLLTSKAMAAQTMGKVGVSRDLIAFAAVRSDGTARLAVWALGKNTLSRWRIPRLVVPSGDLPPVISGAGRFVAVVSAGYRSLAVLDLSKGSWLAPVARGAEVSGGRLVWDWVPLAHSSLARGSWRRESWQGRDRFMVDEKGQAIWAVLANPPAGATAVPGGFQARSTHDQLAPLDLERRTLSWEAPGTGSELPRVWSSYLAAISSDGATVNLSVLYNGETWVDCVLYGRVGQGQWAETVLRRDGSIRHDLLSLSKDGTRLAVCLVSGQAEEVQVMDRVSKRTTMTWRP